MPSSPAPALSLADDFRFAYDKVAFAHHAAREALGIEELDPWQREFLSSRAKRILLLCCRQSGKTSITAIAALHRALYSPGSLTLVFGPSQDQSVEFFRKVSLMYRVLAQDLPEPESLTKMGLELPNGSRIQARPGSEKTSRGRTASLIILDEASRIDDELYDALRPSLAVSSGDLYMLSTPFGKRGTFYEAWENGTEWERYRVTADECPRISKEFLENERRERPPHVFAREYECAFLDVDNQLFSTELIDSAITSEITPLFEEAI